MNEFAVSKYLANWQWTTH